MKTNVPIPSSKSSEPSVTKHMEAVAGNMNRITGNATNSEKLQELPVTASLSDVIATVNVMIRRLG